MSTNPSAVVAGNLGGMFGDGSDGAVVLDGVATFPWATLAAGVYSTTRDIFLSSLVINAGVSIRLTSERIFCRGPVTGPGTIQANGNNAAAAVGGAAIGNFVLTGANGGGTGGTGAGAAGGAANGNGGQGGAGGNSGATVGGAGGALTGGVIPASAYKVPAPMLVGIFAQANAQRNIGGGTGGGSGAGDGVNAGGGGGSGAGVICIFAFTITGVTIQAIGGNGAAGVAGNAGGGGGGGGGSIALYTFQTPSGLTTSVAGGALGAGVGTGSPGVVGGAGTLLQQVLS